VRISQIYANRSESFIPLVFNRGLNVVLAEIRLPENRKRDTHNLGKTTLGQLLNFCLLSERDSKMFLFRHEDLFRDFVFYLELENVDGSFLTLRRSVREASKVSFKRHEHPHQDFRKLEEKSWDHWNLPFSRSKKLLDGFLDLRAVSPWGYRKGLGYLLRSQRDYRHVFQLERYVKHADWKPYVAHVLGLDSVAISELYSVEAEIQRLNDREQLLVAEAGGLSVTSAKVDGMLLIKNTEIAKKSAILDTYDFADADSSRTDELVNDLDVRIADLNQERYSLAYARKQLLKAIEVESVSFDSDDVATLFGEMNVMFDGQLKRDFDQLVEFNKAISEERRGYLDEELRELEGQLKPIVSELATLNKQRTQALQYLGGSDTFQRFRTLSDELIELKAEALALERQREQLEQIHALRNEIANVSVDLRLIQAKVENDLSTKSDPHYQGIFTNIRLRFSEIIRTVLDRDALLTVDLNSQNHPEFRAEILDAKGESTSADEGVSYRKLLCVAFDLAVLHSHLSDRFPRFAFHDGIFEGLDPRKKVQLMRVLRDHADAGIQLIITSLDSDLPPGEVDDSDVVLTLHDEGEDGRLFRFASW
jgi:uncharacterized protein YydD (DUF2326 family)